MDNTKNLTNRAESYRIFFEKSSKIVKKISDSFIYDPKMINPQTNIIWDKKVSDKIRDELALNSELSDFKFYSEEEPGENLDVPIFLIDPIDGSREFLRNIAECSVCLSFVESWKLEDLNKGAHLVWNFRNNFGAMLVDGEVTSIEGKIDFKQDRSDIMHGFVSRREWEEGVFQKIDKRISVEPVGSIAYKLALLSQGHCDFVFSRSDKNIWDITAGSFISKAMGYSLYNQHGKVVELTGPLLKGPLLWCRDEHHGKLSEVLIK